MTYVPVATDGRSRPLSATALLALALAVLTAFGAPDVLRTCAPVPAAPGLSPGVLARADFQRGVNLVGWSPGELASGSTAAVLSDLLRLGASWVSLVPTWYQPTWDAPGPGLEGRDGGSTLTEVRHAVEFAHRIGLKVAVKPHVDARDGRWRGEFQPGGAGGSLGAARAWLNAYRERLLDLADLVRETGVEQLVIGTELIRLSTDPRLEPDWRSLISEVRARFPGLLTYGANWGAADGEYRRVPWWDALDAVGVNAYFPLTNKSDPGLRDLADGWQVYRDGDASVAARWVDDLAGVQRQTGRPVLFTEVGFPSHSDAARRPWHYDDAAAPAPALQARAYAATFVVWSQVPWLAGLYWWVLPPNPAHGGLADPSHTFRGKPAAGVVARWYGAAAAGTCVRGGVL